MLIYSTEPLEEDLEVTGPVRLVLYASSSAPDTDFTAKLVDVNPCGFARNLTEGIIRARFRESFAHEKMLTPGEVTEFTIDMWSTSNMFQAGHRIRLEISSSNFPRFDRNPNTGHELFADAETRPAIQTRDAQSRLRVASGAAGNPVASMKGNPSRSQRARRSDSRGLLSAHYGQSSRRMRLSHTVALLFFG